ncbi:MAG: tetratricopeptide repeat protein [Gammaproteobacteria bacterium]|nr:tetratricopeptide repeat protein [Gammaproteobacteria bacterium]
MKWHVIVLTSIVLLPGCSFLFKDKQAPEPLTIASIENKPVSIEAGGNLDASRDQAIKSYRKFLNSAQQNQYHAEAMRRIADLELESLEERAASFTGGDEELSTRPADYDKVVSLYKSMLKNHPDYPNNDGVLYQLAKVYEQSGEIENALNVFDQLIKQYPQSSFITEVQFRRGEILFVLRRYKESTAAYSSVVNDKKDTPFFERAVYKLGWSNFKRGRFEDALNSFFRILDIKFSDSETGDIQENITEISRGEKELLQDSFRVISLSFAYLDGPRSVDNYFKKNGKRPYGYRVYRHLGNLYMKQERIRDAADAYNAFVRGQPDHHMAPDFQTDVINAYKKGGFLSLTLKAKEEFADRYNKSSLFWQNQSEENRNRIAKLLKVHLEDLARYYHAQAQKQKKAKLYRHAAKWYHLYIDSFPDDNKTPLMNFLLAELLFEAKDYLNAANEYEKTAYNYKSHPKMAEAGYATLLAFRKYEQRLSSSQRKKFHGRTIDSGIRFADTFPKNKNTPTVLTSAAEDLFKARQFERAETIARRVIDIQPPVKKALRKTAWTVLAHTQFENKQYALAEQSYIQVLSLGNRKSKQYADIHERMIASVYKQGESSRDKGDHQAAVKHFLRIGKLAPRSKIRPTSQYDAAASLIILKNWRQAASVLEDFRRRFPKNSLTKTIPDKLALVYLSSKQHSKAASEMIRIAKGSKNITKAREARWQAAELYEKSGANSKAIKAYTKYFTLYPKPFERAMEARNKITETYKRLGNRRQYNKWLKKMVKAESRGGANRTTRTRYIAVSAAYILAKPARTSFKKIRLTIPLKRSLKRKKKSMKKALKAYENIAKYKVSEFTTAATYQIAEIYHQFSKDLIKSQRPRRLKADELEQYDILLEEQAYPFEEKAIKIHDTNASRTTRNIYDKWVKKSFDVLIKLQPVRYLKPERSESASDVIF